MFNRLFNRQEWGLRVVRLNRFFSKPLGGIVAFGFMLLLIFIYFQQSNRTLLQNTKIATENSAQASLDTKQLLLNVDAGQKRTEKKIDQSTLILCRIILKSSITVNLTPAEEELISETCQSEIDRQQAEQSRANTPPLSVHQQSDKQKIQPVPEQNQQVQPAIQATQSDTSQPQETEEDPAPLPLPEEPTIVQRALNSLSNLVSPVTNLLKGGR